jgi:uncharacterized membrane protein YbhN (UPF0104 family)
MSTVGSAVATVTPFDDPSRRKRLLKVVGWIVGIAVVLVVLNLLGVDVWGWISKLWDEVSAVGVGYLLAGISLQLVQTTFNGVAYYGILRYAYPDGNVKLWPIVTAYAVGVGMNTFLPGNIGTLVTLLMFLALIPGSTFAGILAAYVVDKIFFSVVGAVVYLYLFLRAGKAFDVHLGWFRHHWLLGLLIVVAGAFLIVSVGRVFWRWLEDAWRKAKQGGKILASPKAYTVKVLVPQLISYAAKVGVIAVFLAAYAIPVTFNSVMLVIGWSSTANLTSVTPGSVGVTQAANVVALKSYATADTVTASSLSQQLVTSATNVVYALVLVLLVFGWTGGKALVEQSYESAKTKAAEKKAEKKKPRGKSERTDAAAGE